MLPLMIHSAMSDPYPKRKQISLEADAHWHAPLAGNSGTCSTTIQSPVEPKNYIEMLFNFSLISLLRMSINSGKWSNP